MGDVRSSADLDDDDGGDHQRPSPPPLCRRASKFPLIRLCSRRSSPRASSPAAAPRDADDGGTVTAPAPPVERRVVRDRNGRILFYYAPLRPTEAVECRVSLSKSRSAGEIISTASTLRFALPLQVFSIITPPVDRRH